MDTLTKSCSPTIVITANGEVQKHEEATVYVKELDKFLTMKVLENTPAVLSLGKLCDENGYSYEWIHGQKPHLIKDGIRIPCNTENFVPIVVPGLSSSSSGSSSALRTPMKQESHSSSSSSSSPSSPTVGDLSVREREDVINSDIYPVPVSEFVDDTSGRPDETQANKTPKTNKKETTIERGDPSDSEIPEWLQEFRENLVDDEIPLQGGSHASSSREVSLEPIAKRREDLGKHNGHAHFLKDRSCEICKLIQLQRHLQDKRGLVLHLPQVHLHQRHHQVIMRLEKERIELKVIPLQSLCQFPMLMVERSNPLWTKNFQKNK